MTTPTGTAGADAASPTVAFIGGTGRSGSTLVSRALGSARGTCSVGELCWLWSYGLQHDRPCGCGRAFSECDFWQPVGEAAFGGWDQVDAGRAADLRRVLQRNRHVTDVWRGGGRLEDELSEYTALMGPLYRAIAEVADSPVVVDNSKQLGAALIARATPGVDLRIIHLVRRSHGVAHSWTKHVERSDMDGAMRRRTPARTALKWVADNALFEALGRSGTPWLLERYEDFVADPRAALERMLAFVGLPHDDAALSFVDGREVDLVVDHSVWGNPMRLSSGPTAVRADRGWIEGMDDRDRRIVTALSLPGLARHRYLGRPTDRPDS